jgi:hypothetical protein
MNMNIEQIEEAFINIRSLWKNRHTDFPNWHGFGVIGSGDALKIQYFILPGTDSGKLIQKSAFLPPDSLKIKELPRFRRSGQEKGLTPTKLRPGTGVRSVSTVSGNPNCRTRCPGTIGAFLRQRGTMEPVWLLSNHHVLVGDEDCLPVKVFSQQGDLISSTVGFVPIEDSGNLVDVAVAKIQHDAADPLYDPLKVTSPTPITLAYGDFVQKLGAVTNLTCGRVSGLRCTVDVLDCGENNNSEFINQISVDSVGPPFLEKGDSGSLVASKGFPAGLLFAIANPSSADPPAGLANPWQQVLDSLATTIDPNTKQPIIPPPVEMMLTPNIRTVDPCPPRQPSGGDNAV